MPGRCQSLVLGLLSFQKCEKKRNFSLLQSQAFCYSNRKQIQMSTLRGKIISDLHREEILPSVMQTYSSMCSSDTWRPRVSSEVKDGLTPPLQQTCAHTYTYPDQAVTNIGAHCASIFLYMFESFKLNPKNQNMQNCRN